MLQKYFWLFLAVLTAVIGLYHFQTSPGFWFDEGIMAQAAKNIAFEGVYGIQTAPGSFYTNNFWITTGYPLVFPVALFLKIFGVSIWASRIAPLLYLIAFVIVSYFFIKKLYGFNCAVLAGLLLTTFPPLYGNGKAVLGEIPGLFWLVFGAFLYLLYEENKENGFLIGSALAFGLCVATKPYYVLVVPGIAFLILFSWLKQKNLNYKQVFVFSALFSLPILAWAYFAFDFSTSQNLSATISYFLNSYGASSFDLSANLFRFVSESTPIHFAVLALAALVSFSVSLKKKNYIPPITAVFLIFTALAFLWYLKTPGWYRYFFPAHVVLILLFPAALGIFVRRFYTATAVSALIVFQAVFLFLNYDDVYGDDALRLKDYAQKNIESSAGVFVSSLPEAVFVLDNKNFYQRIFISSNFELGEDFSKYGNVDYMITANSDEEVHGYFPAGEVGHYKIYKKI